MIANLHSNKDRKIREDKLHFYQMGLSLFEGRVLCVFLLNISLVPIKYRMLWKRIVA
jgi:hypothetical protein